MEKVNGLSSALSRYNEATKKDDVIPSLMYNRTSKTIWCRIYSETSYLNGLGLSRYGKLSEIVDLQQVLSRIRMGYEEYLPKWMQEIMYWDEMNESQVLELIDWVEAYLKFLEFINSGKDKMTLRQWSQMTPFIDDYLRGGNY